MNTYWRNHPPLHLMVAAYLGIKPESKSTAGGQPDDQPDLVTLLAQFPQGGMSG
ncbi:hypothetical protein [Chromobacterium haemolyticum]|uniref:hypothetical protein n=1 Tax=Chromobacterium haemolyticum TaxID=394935 RepID=UPI001593C203|nr:hypothetical protein [Chromobacterium haemolyticum]